MPQDTSAPKCLVSSWCVHARPLHPGAARVLCTGQLQDLSGQEEERSNCHETEQGAGEDGVRYGSWSLLSTHKEHSS